VSTAAESEAASARRAAAAHDRLVTALYDGDWEEAGGVRYLLNRHLAESELSYARPLDGGEADWPAREAAVREYYGRRRRAAAVVSDAWSAPPALAELLGNRGWRPAFAYSGLIFPARRSASPPGWPPAADVVELRCAPAEDAGERAEAPPPELERFLDVFESAFRETAPEYDFSGYRAAIPAAWRAPRTGVELVHTLVTIRGEPAATGSRALADGVAGLYNLGVAPSFRGLGLGGAVTRYRVATARAAGAEVVYLMTEDPRVEAAQLRRGFLPGFVLSGWLAGDLS
jgi:GNAT superfamily N-acetyltransferase